MKLSVPESKPNGEGGGQREQMEEEKERKLDGKVS